MGFLNCYHENDESALESLWGLINPEMNNNVEKSKIMEVFEMIMSLAIEIPLEIYKNDEEHMDVLAINYLEALALDSYRPLDLQREKFAP